MIKIGDLAKISQVPVSTLRFYDEMGLLKPVEVDRFTGYRYYDFDQLKRLYRILALRDLGISLEQIGRLLCQDLPVAELRGMLKIKQIELRKLVDEEMSRLERVESRLDQLEREAYMSNYDVVIKKIDPVLVAGVRGIIPDYPVQGGLWSVLEGYLQRQGITPKGACFTMYLSQEPEIEAEVCEPLAAAVSGAGEVQVHELPAVEMMASTVHHGPFTTIGDAHTGLFKWLDENGYKICGPEREIYLKPPAVPGSQTDPDTVTEIQFPVEKV